MRFRRIALWSAGSLVVLLAGGCLWLWFGNPGVFKPQLERWVSEKTGREFVIEGRLDVDLGRETVIVAERIRFENADWSATRDMLEVGYLELRIDTLSAFDALLTIELIKLDDVEVRLERPASADPNWVLVPPSAPVSPEPGDDSSVLDVIVRKIDTDNVRIVYESTERTGPLELRIATLRQQHRSDDFLELALDGSLNEQNFDIHAVAGTWQALLAQKNVEFDLGVQLDEYRISGKGTIDDLAAPRRPSLTFAASGPDINDLLRLLRLQEGGSGVIDLTGSLRPDGDGPMILDIEGRLGRATVDATARLPDLQSFERFEVTAQASGSDLGRILALAGFEGVREAPFAIDIEASRQDALLEIERAHLELADATFDFTGRLPAFPGLDAGSASLEISGSDFSRLRELLRLPGAADGPFSLGLKLDSDASGEETLRIALTSTLVSLEAGGRIADDRNYLGSDLSFTLRSESLARIGQAYGVAQLPDLPMTISGSMVVEENAIRLPGPLTAEMDGSSLRLEGSIARAPRLDGSRLSFRLDAPDLARLVGMFAVAEQVPPLPIDMGGELSIDRDSFVFHKVSGDFGQSSLGVDGTLRLGARLAGSEFNLTSSGPAFEELVAHIPNFDVQPGAYDLSGRLEFAEDALRFEGVDLSRPRGRARANATIGLSRPEAFIDFDISAQGERVRSLLPALGPFEFDDAAFSVTARGGLRGARLALDRFDVEIGQATVAARGDLDLAPGGRPSDFEFELSVPSLARLGLLEGRRPREQGLTIAARFRGDRQAVSADNLVVSLGDSDLRGSLRLQKGDVPNLEFELESDLLRIAPLLEAAADYEAQPEFDDGRLIPDIKVPFEAMKSLNATVAVDIGELQREEHVVHAVTLRVELRDGGLYVHEAGFRSGDGSLRARAALQPAGGSGKASLALKAENLTLGIVGLGGDSSAKAGIDVNLEAVGTDVRALAGSSSGVIFLDARNLVVPSNTFLTRLYGDMLNEILETINPFVKSESETQISCIVLPIEIDDGRLGVNPEALLQTDKVRIVSDASINLKSEKIEMSFRTTPKKGLTISAGEILNPFVMVVGTLAEPRLAVDAKGTLISGGAAVATGGLSILAKATWERLARSKNPCQTAAGQGLENLQDRFAEFPEEEASGN